MPDINLDGAVGVAIESFESTPGDERTRLVAALEAYTIALRGIGLIPPSRPAYPFDEDAESAARWLGETSGHPRYVDPHWRTLLAPGHDLTLVQAAVRTRAGLAPDTPAAVREAVRLVTAQQAADGAPAGEEG